MEILKYTDIRPVVSTAQIPEGRMVLITSHSQSDDSFQSMDNLPGIKVPATAAEALKARYVASVALINQSAPIYQSPPSVTFSLRDGFGGANNVPFQATVHLTPPSMTKQPTILTNSIARAFAQGEFIVFSGDYVANESLVPGDYLEALNTADDGASLAGVLARTTDAALAIAEVIKYDSDNQELHFRTFNP